MILRGVFNILNIDWICFNRFVLMGEKEKVGFYFFYGYMFRCV